MSGRTKFLIYVLVLYGVISIFNQDTIRAALVYFALMLSKVIPVLGMVFGFLFLTNLFIKPEWIRKHIGAESGFRGWFYAVIGGIVISGPPYIIYPMLGELKEHGARSGLLAVILFNRNVKPQFLPAMIYLFGIKYTVILSVYIILFSLLSGKILEFFVREENTSAGR